jgi:fatty acid desaturase
MPAARARAPSWLRKAMAAGRPLHANKQDRRDHNLRNLSAVGALIAGGIGIVLAGGAPGVPLWLYLPLASFLLGCLYMGLFVLVVHEASHDMFLLTADRKRLRSVNRLAGNIVGAVFFTDYVRHWEVGHTLHHTKCLMPEDPQDGKQDGLRSLRRSVAILLLVPFSFVAYNPSRRYPGNLRRSLLGVAIWLPLLVVAGLIGGWAAPVAMLGGFHVLSLLNLLKKVREHGGLESLPHQGLRSRTWFHPLSALIAPFHLNYHFEHHAHPKVPWYLLPEYHRRCRELMPAEVQEFYFVDAKPVQLRHPPVPDGATVGVP